MCEYTPRNGKSLGWYILRESDTMFLWHNGEFHDTVCQATNLSSDLLYQDGYWKTEQEALDFLNQWEKENGKWFNVR